MGKEIVYCEICGDRILEQEFEKGKAVTILNKNYCSKCKEEAVKNITMDDVFEEGVDATPRKSRSSSMMKAVKADLPTRTPPKGMSRPDVKVTTPPPKTPAPRAPRPAGQADKSSRNAMIIGGSIGGLALLFLVILMATSGKSDGSKKEEPVKKGGEATAVDKGSSARAEKAWSDVQNFAADPRANPDDILAKITIEEPNVKNTEYERRLAELKEKYLAKREEVKHDGEISDLLREVEGIRLSDPGFNRCKEVREKLQLAQRKADPLCRGRLPEITKVQAEYTAGYEKAAEPLYIEINEYAVNLAKEGRYRDAIIKIDTYPEHFRESMYWKNLKYLRDEYERKKGSEAPPKKGDGKQG